MKNRTLIPAVAVLFAMVALFTSRAQDKPLSLAGDWRFQLDRADAGINERWFERQLPGRIKLPGGLTEQGIGDPVTVDTKWIGGIVDRSWFSLPEYAKYREPGNVKVPFWLQPERYYAGAAWFQRDVEIPPSWAARRVVLALERPHWETRLWVDGRALGTNNSLGTPHEFDLGQLTAGRHTLTVRVDNRMILDVGENSHSVSDHTQGNWNGIVGEIELRSTPLVWIEEVQVYPEVTARAILIRGYCGHLSGQSTRGTVELEAGLVSHGSRKQHTSVACRDDGEFEARLPLGDDALLWDEFNPALYELTATLTTDQGIQSKRQVRFGLREFSTQATQFTVNGRKVFFRGTLECAIHPRTGHPPTGLEEWRRIIRVAKAHGLNMIRFHSWCPPEAAFVAADELGFYLHVECSSWANGSTTLGDGKPVDDWIYAEADRILKAYGNHPSFVLFLYGNEPGGGRHQQFLAKWVEDYKARDPRRLVTSAAGWPQLSENQFHITPDPRIQGWGEGLKSRINAKPPETSVDYRDYISRRSVPVISHEIGQWCVYPRFDEVKKYTGYLKPRNFEIFHDRLEANALSRFAKQFLLASGKLQALCYKEDIESALRTPAMGGFQLLDLHDFPGQGTALVGVLDPFWEEKGYISAREFSRFCNSTVLLARLPRRVFTTTDRFTAPIELAHFGAAPLKDSSVEWKLVGGEARVYARGELRVQTVTVDNGVIVGTVDVDLKKVKAPTRCKLEVKLRGTSFSNDWDIWVYPGKSSSDSARDVLVTSAFDDAAKERLRAGGQLLLTIPGKHVRNFDVAPVKLGFSSIFWNTAWTGRQPPTTLGILCDPKHLALARFPTEYHSNWQWWYLIHRAGALRLDLLPPETEPVVRVIDDWFTARSLALIVEGKVGKGRIVVCGFDLTHDADDPVSRQMRSSLVHYLGSTSFKGATRFTTEQIQSLLIDPMTADLGGVRSITASSEQPGYEVTNAIDGDPNTIWHTAWGEGAPGFPHELNLDFKPPRRVEGLSVLPRQDGNRNGWIKNYEVYTSADGSDWGMPLARGEFAANGEPKTVKIAASDPVRFLKLRALSGYSNGPWASLAELKILPYQ